MLEVHSRDTSVVMEGADIHSEGDHQDHQLNEYRTEMNHKYTHLIFYQEFLQEGSRLY